MVGVVGVGAGTCTGTVGVVTGGIWMFSSGVPGGTFTCTGTVVPLASVTLTVTRSAEALGRVNAVASAITTAAASTI